MHDPDRKLVTVVIPAKDEEEGVREILRALPVKTLRSMGLDTEVFLLDGNSRDGTRDVAAAYGATILTDPEPGKGAAFRHARSSFNGDLIVMLDGDGTYPVDAIPRVVAPLLRDDADVVMGSRVAQPDAMSVVHRFGNTMLSFMASVLHGRPCPDVCTGMWAFHRDVLLSLPLQSSGFELEAELFAMTARLEKRILSVQIDYLPRIGESKLSTMHGFHIAWHLVRTRFMPLPMDDRPRPRLAADPRVTADELPHPQEAGA